jgi:hypothetical protein
MGRGGESAGPLPTPADFLDSDPRFAAFLEDDFNAGDFASQALAKAEVTAKAQAEQLQVNTLLLATLTTGCHPPLSATGST